MDSICSSGIQEPAGFCPTKPTTPVVRNTRTRSGDRNVTCTKAYPGNSGISTFVRRSLHCRTEPIRGRKTVMPWRSSSRAATFSCRERVRIANQRDSPPSTAVAGTEAKSTIWVGVFTAPPSQSHLRLHPRPKISSSGARGIARTDTNRTTYSVLKLGGIWLSNLSRLRKQAMNLANETIVRRKTVQVV